MEALMPNLHLWCLRLLSTLPVEDHHPLKRRSINMSLRGTSKSFDEVLSFPFPMIASSFGRQPSVRMICSVWGSDEYKKLRKVQGVKTACLWIPDVGCRVKLSMRMTGGRAAAVLNDLPLTNSTFRNMESEPGLHDRWTFPPHTERSDHKLSSLLNPPP